MSSVVTDEVSEVREQLAANERELATVLATLDAIPDWLRVGEPDRFARAADRGQARQAERLRVRAFALARDQVRLGATLDDLEVGAVTGFPAESTYGVVLPLRLETRFVRPKPGAAPGTRGARWKLRVRVEPDPIAMPNPPSPPTRREAGLLERFWNQAKGDLSTRRGEHAFSVLARAVGPARATWLMRNVDVDRRPGGGFTLVKDFPATTTPPPALVALPRHLEVWGGSSSSPRRLLRLAPRRGEIAAQASLEAVRPRRAGALPRTWWTSYAAAAKVGLAGEIVLGEERPSFEVLMCVGLGAPEMEPSVHDLFRVHVRTGRVGTMAPLTPTNTVQGEPAGDVDRDPARWLSMMRLPKTTLGGLATTLFDEDLVTGVPEPDLGRQRAASSLVTALWPVLWQRALKDLVGLGDQTFRLGSYAGRHLHPFGPFPTLRLGDVPYGVLPVADFDRMLAAGEPQAPLERAVLRAVSHLAPPLAAAAGARPPLVGADEAGILEVLGKLPSSREYGTRSYPATHLLAMLAAALGGRPVAETVEEWERQAALLREVVPVLPARRHSPAGFVESWPQEVSAQWSDTLHAFLQASRSLLVEADDLSTEWRSSDGRPIHPLARLVRHALMLTQVELGRLGTATVRPRLEAYLLPLSEPGRFRSDAMVVGGDGPVREVPSTIADLVGPAAPIRLGRRDAAVRQYEDVRRAVEELAGSDPATVESVLTGALDSAGHRLDVWYTALAHRRLRQVQAVGARPVLGAYGWVDDLEPSRDETPPTTAGLVHAPGHAQALTAALLRDHAVHQPGDDRWRLTLQSDGVRHAAELADQVRTGIDLSEVLGREIERRFPAPGKVLELRQLYRARPEWEGRRVCDGQAVLADVRDPPGQLPDWFEPKRVEPLLAALDAYADLLVADALHTVVEGRADAAGDALEAAAGLGAPPELRLLRTRREGATVRTEVRLALPWRPAWETTEITPTTSPIGVADPALARWLTAELGRATAVAWTDQERPDRRITLAQLGLGVADALLYEPAALDELARERLGAPRRLGGTARTVLPRAARLADLLGAAPPEAPEAEAVLRARLKRLRAVATELARDLRRPPSGTVPRRRLAERARRFGLSLDLWRDQAELEVARAALATRREGLGTQDAKATAAELARRIRLLLPTASALPLLCPDTLPALSANRRVLGEWLPVVAAVRPRMAALEAAALLSERDWPAATTDEREDPWAPPPRSRHGGSTDAERVVVVGPGTPVAPGGGSTRAGRSAAVCRLDSWGETLPAPRHTSWTAFGYDAPRARAPQAVLVVVPADSQGPLDLAQVRGAVLKTRQLARVRSLTGEAPAGVLVGVPLGVVETGGSGAVTMSGESS